MPQSLRTLLLTCLAWFMPLHALDATTGQWHPAAAAELSSADETAWVAGDWLIDTRAPAVWVVPGVEVAELQRSTASAARLSVPTVPPADAVVQVLGHGAHLRPLHTVAPGERIAWDGHIWWVESIEGAVTSATAAVASGSAAPDGAEGPAPVDVTAAVEPPAALHVTLQATGLRLQRVLATRARPADDVHTLTIRSADGTLQSIRGTADHPVYVQGGDTFQALATLRPGDAVRALDGRPSTVVSVTPDPGPRTVHNLTVEFAPTYFIDAEVREGWGGIWVHNTCWEDRDLSGLSTSDRRSVRSLIGRLREHEAKLAEYRADPFAYDNQGHLARAAGDPERQADIIRLRINSLEREIERFSTRLEEILGPLE